MTTTFENAKVGDKVWDFNHGFGEIEHIKSKSEFPLKIRFVSGSGYTFTLKGQNLLGIPQTLFWDEIKFEIPAQPPRTKIINGIEVPDISFKPSEHDAYYYPDPAFPTLVFSFPYRFTASENNEFRIKNNLCYPYTEEGKQAAMLHAKAMLGIKE